MAFKEIVDIGWRRAGGTEPCLVVAEVGPNHNGDPDQALALVDAAAQAGCDAVKFQYHIAEAEIFDRTTKSYYYDETRYDFIKRVQEFPHEVHGRIRDRAKEHRMLYLCSVFSEAAVERVAALDPDAFKLPSGEIGNPWLLEQVARTGKPIVASSGMSDAGEIDAMMGGARRDHRPGRAAPLPVRVSDRARRHAFADDPGASRAVRMPGRALRSQPQHRRDRGDRRARLCHDRGALHVRPHARGPDHHVSLLPGEMASLVSAVRNLERALGQPQKVLGAHAGIMRASFTNSIVTRRAIRSGETLSRENLTLMKPATGLPASELPQILGRRASADLAAHVALRREDVA